MPYLPLCYQFASRSEYVRNWIQRQNEVKEESLTDWLLDNISSTINGISYEQFNRHEEAKVTGADWEWWFVFSRNSCFSMRIQAKKLHISDNYADIARSNRHGLQIEKLIKDAKENNFFPLYAFYSTDPSSRCCITTQTDEGVFLAAAETIKSKFITNGKKVVSSSDILPLCVTLSKFVCSQCAAATLVQKRAMRPNTLAVFELFFKSTLKHLLGFIDSDVNGVPVEIDGFKKVIPLYVYKMLNRDINDSDFIIDDQVFPACEKILVTDMREMKNLFLF